MPGILLSLRLRNLKFYQQVSSQLELLSEELQHMEVVNDSSKAEQLLQIHNESVRHVQNCTYELVQRGQDLAQVSKSTMLIYRTL